MAETDYDLNRNKYKRLSEAKAKLAANRKSGKGGAKHTLTKEENQAIMDYNRELGGSDVGEKRQTPKKRGGGVSGAAKALKNRGKQIDAQTTDSSNKGY